MAKWSLGATFGLPRFATYVFFTLFCCLNIVAWPPQSACNVIIWPWFGAISWGQDLGLQLGSQRPSEVTGIFVDNAKALKRLGLVKVRYGARSADEDAMYLEALTERRRWVAEVKERESLDLRAS